MNAQSKNWRGEVTYFFLDRKNKTFKWVKAHNDIQPEARSIVIKTLTGLVGPIDKIIAVTPSETSAKTIYQVQYPTTRSVAFFALYEENEAVGEIQSLALAQSEIGQFSWFNTIAVNKPNNIQLLVRWTITMDSCEGLEPEPTLGNGFLYQDGTGILLQDGTGLKLNLPE